MKNLLCLILVAIAITAGAMFVIGRYGGSKIGDSAVEASPSAEAKEADKDAQSEEKPRSESSERSPEPDPAGKGLATPTRLFKVVKEVVSPAVASFLAELESPMSKQPQVEPEGQAAATRAKPAPRLTLPGPLRRVRFGMLPAQVAAAYPVAWERESRDTLTLVHYFNRSMTEEGRFEFRKELGLQRIVVRVKVPVGANSADLYKKIQKDHVKRYGSLPGSKHDRWSDGRITVSVKRQPEYVALSYATEK